MVTDIRGQVMGDLVSLGSEAARAGVGEIFSLSKSGIIGLKNKLFGRRTKARRPQVLVEQTEGYRELPI